MVSQFVECTQMIKLYSILRSRVKKSNLMQNFFLVYFVKIYMFRAYLSPSSGGTTICIKQLALIILFRCLSVGLVGLESIPIQRG